MSGKFNPFQSKESEVVRDQVVTDVVQARKVLAKVQRKRACLWAEIRTFDDPATERSLGVLTGETSVVLFIAVPGGSRLPSPMPSALDALISRLWKNFNKLWLVRMVGEPEDLSRAADSQPPARASQA